LLLCLAVLLELRQVDGVCSRAHVQTQRRAYSLYVACPLDGSAASRYLDKALESAERPSSRTKLQDFLPVCRAWHGIASFALADNLAQLVGFRAQGTAQALHLARVGPGRGITGDF
jgi:hypothetical protein